MPYEFLGEYLDENGLPVAGAKVIANQRDNGSVLGIATTDSEGNFVIPAMEAPTLAYVTVLQDGFIPQIFDNVTSEYYTVDFDAPVLSAEWTGQFDLSWTEGADPFITEFIVYRSTDGGPYEVLTIVPSTDPYEATDTLVNRTLHSYAYKVVASDGLGSVSPDSNIESFPPFSAVAFALSNSNRIGRSTDMNSFTAISTPGGVSKQMQGIGFSQTQNRAIICCNTVVSGSRMMYSDDSGLTWADIPGLPSVVWRGITRSDTANIWVAVGDHIAGVPQIWTSVDGITGWTLNNTGAAANEDYREPLWVEEFGLFVVSGLPASIFDDNSMLSSPDGLVWTVRFANSGGWGHGDKIVFFAGAVWAYGTGSSTIIKTVNGTSWGAGGNLVLAGKNSIHGLSDGTRAFMCQGSNAITKTAGGNPLLQASWSVFTDLGFIGLDVWAPPEFGNLVLVSRATGHRLSSDGGVTFAGEVAWPGALNGTVAKVRSALLTIP